MLRRDTFLPVVRRQADPIGAGRRAVGMMLRGAIFALAAIGAVTAFVSVFLAGVFHTGDAAEFMIAAALFMLVMSQTTPPE